jgi:hypothetical protein
MDLYRVWKLELESHNVDLFYDGEWTKSLVVQFFWRLNCFDVLSLKPNLVFDFEIWLILMLYINILHVSSLCLLKVGYKLCFNVCQPHNSIFHSKIHDVMHTLDVRLTCANHGSQKKLFFVLMIALYCCVWTLPWSWSLTNYLDVDWLCITNIIPRFDWLFGGGRLMITSFSHLTVQKIASKNWMQTRVHDRNIYILKAHDIKKHDQEITWLNF